MKKSPIFISCLLLMSLFSCKENDDTSTSQAYSKGIFVINEGAFQSGTGTISFYNRDKKAVEQDIFGLANNGAVLGNIAQSMSIFNEKAYTVINNAGKIEVTEAGTFKSIATITGLEQPRYFLAINNNKGYATQWGKDGLTGELKVIDLTSNKITKSIPLGKGAEQLVFNNNTLYVTLSGGFDKDNRVALINTNTDEVTYINTPDNPESILLDKNGAVWVLCMGYTDYVDFSKSTKGGLVKIENNKATATYPLNNGTNSLCYSATTHNLYFLDNGLLSWTSANITGTPSIKTVTDAKLSKKYYYTLGLDPTTNNLLAADPIDFKSNGLVHIINQSNLTLADSFKVGVIPTYFYFR